MGVTRVTARTGPSLACFSAPPSFVASPPPDASFEQIFHHHYPAVRGLLGSRPEPGLALLVVSSNGAEASGWFAAKDAAINPLIVGRHSSAEVFLPADTRLSLPGVRARPLDPPPQDLGATTLLSTFAGPVFPRLDPDESDPPRGELLVASASGRAAVHLGPRAEHRGVLLGRYERCDTTGLPVLVDPALSRVHFLVFELDEALCAIDTASKNGSWCNGQRVRATRLQPGLRVSLAGKATVEWRPFHGGRGFGAGTRTGPPHS